MDEELNYLSEKIDELESEIDNLEDTLSKGFGTGGRIGKEYKKVINKLRKEKDYLETILNFITIKLLDETTN